MTVLKDITSIFALFLGIHYLYSFYVINKKLERVGVSTFSIISAQDVLFPLAGKNMYVIFGLVVIFAEFILVKLCIKKFNIEQHIKEIIKPKAGNEWVYLIMLIVILIIITTRIFYLKNKNNLNGLMFMVWVFLLISSIAFDEYENEFLVGFSICLFFWGFHFLRTKDDTKEHVSFKYDGDKKIKSDNHNTLIFYGSRYIVMHNDSSNTTTLFETDKVTHFTKRIVDKEKADIKTKEQK